VLSLRKISTASHFLFDRTIREILKKKFMFSKIVHIFTRTAIVFSITLGSTSNGNAQSTPSQALRDVQILASEKMQGREMASTGNALAREYILQRIKEIGLKPCGMNYLQEFDFTDRSGKTIVGKNILACQAGTQANARDRLSIVVSAHYDHLGMRNGEIYFGADDNASGVAGVLAVASHLSQVTPQNNLVYAFFDGEEKGLLGAHAFVKQATIPLEKIAVNVNFDMIARGDKNELYVSGTHQTPSLKDVLQSLNGTNGIRLFFGHDQPEQGHNDWTSQSDHYPFFKAGIPHLYFGVEDHPDYHKPSDTVDKINPLFFDGSIALVIQAVVMIDSAIKQVDFRSERKKYRK
jgi:hypothetical protein